MENLRLLFELYVRPVAAMSELMDKGSWLLSAVFVLIVSTAFYWTINAKLQEAYVVPRFDVAAYEQFADEEETP